MSFEPDAEADAARGLASTSVGATADALATSISGDGVRSSPTHAAGRPQRLSRPGMSFGHDVLLALIMAVAMTATVLLYR